MRYPTHLIVTPGAPLGLSAMPWQRAEPFFPPEWRRATQKLFDNNYHHHNVEGSEIQLWCTTVTLANPLVDRERNRCMCACDKWRLEHPRPSYQSHWVWKAVTGEMHRVWVSICVHVCRLRNTCPLVNVGSTAHACAWCGCVRELEVHGSTAGYWGRVLS